LKRIYILLIPCLFLAAFLMYRKEPDLFLRRQVVQLFLSRQFEELNALLYSLEEKSQKNMNAEQQLHDAFDAFAVSDPSFEPLFAEWMKKQPDSYSPHLAKAVYEMGLACPNCAWEDLNDTTFLESSAVHFERARLEALAALKINDKLASAYEILMNVNRCLKKTDENISLFQKAIQYSPMSFFLRFSYLMGLASEADLDPDQIHDFISTTLKTGNGNSSLKILQGFLNWREGVLLLKNKQFKEAVNAFTEALSYGSHWKFYFDRAQANFGLNDFDSALKDIQLALKFRPQIEILYLLRAKIYYRLGKFEIAFQDIATAEDIWPYASSIHEIKAWFVEDLIYSAYREYQNRKFESALKTLEYALYLNPAHPEIYSWRSMILKEEGKLHEALIDLKRSTKLNPSNYSSCVALKEILSKNEGQDELTECWTNFLLLNPNRADAYFERGEIYWQAGRKQAAVQDMKTACDLGLKPACEKYESYGK
jgi:tetratricopeptide (TPR) repeat protein